MAASRVDSEVGEYQLTSATAAVLSRSSSEARVVVKSWTGYNHRAEYIEEPLRSKFRDHSPRNSNNGTSGSRCTKNNEERPGQEEGSISENEIRIANRLDVNEDTNRDRTTNDVSNVVNDRKLIMLKDNNEKLSEPRGKLEVTRADSLNNERQVTRQIFHKRNRRRGTAIDNEYDGRHAREIKIATTASTSNCTNNPPESAYGSRGVDKTIESGKCERAEDIEGRKDDCDEGGMEISSARSRAYPPGDNVIVSAATSGTDAFRGALRGEASRKVVHSSAEDNRIPGETRRSAAGDREEPRDRETDVVLRAEDKRRCETCESSHHPYGRFSRARKHSGHLNCETVNRGAARIAVNRTTDSTRLAAPIAAATLRRSRSLPRLSAHDSGVACSDLAPMVPKQTHAAPRQLVADLRQLLTLRQHYYPEGGWGWTILLVGLLVQILSHGAHGAVGVFLQKVEVKFGPRVHLQAG